MKNFVSKVFRWQRLLLLAPLLGVVFALMLVVPAWAATVTTTTQTIPINRTLFNPCNNESVTLSGVAHEVSHVTVDSTGTFHLVATFSGTLTGTGSEGNMYVGSLSEVVTRDGTVPGQFTHTFTTKLISKGSAPNFTTNVFQHFTVNANGTTTVDILDITSTCSG